MNDRQKRIVELSEGWTEKYLAFIIALPPPFSFIVVLLNLLAAAYIGYRIA